LESDYLFVDYQANFGTEKARIGFIGSIDTYYYKEGMQIRIDPLT